MFFFLTQSRSPHWIEAPSSAYELSPDLPLVMQARLYSDEEVAQDQIPDRFINILIETAVNMGSYQHCRGVVLDDLPLPVDFDLFIFAADRLAAVHFIMSGVSLP